MPDDSQPRVKIKKMFNAGMLSTEEEMQQFSENFAIETLDQDIHVYCSSRRSQTTKQHF